MKNKIYPPQESSYTPEGGDTPSQNYQGYGQPGQPVQGIPVDMPMPPPLPSSYQPQNPSDTPSSNYQGYGAFVPPPSDHFVNQPPVYGYGMGMAHGNMETHHTTGPTPWQFTGQTFDPSAFAGLHTEAEDPCPTNQYDEEGNCVYYDQLKPSAKWLLHQMAQKEEYLNYVPQPGGMHQLPTWRISGPYGWYTKFVFQFF